MTDHPITEFLTARLDEDEQAAYAGASACWHIDYCDDAGRDFHQHFTPERLLAEVRAKRVLLDNFETTRQAAVLSGEESLLGVSAGLERAVLDLAAAYRDHPDFWPGWLEDEEPTTRLRLVPPTTKETR